MTIKKKIVLLGGVMCSVFAGLAGLNLWAYQHVLAHTRTREAINTQRLAIEAFAGWKNALVRSVSNCVASGRVSELACEQLAAFPDALPVQRETLLTAAQMLLDAISQHERALRDIDQTYEETRAALNEVYARLDKQLATVLAIAQMDQVLGGDTSAVSALAPYALKSLNQLTVVALNALVSRSFTEDHRRVVAQNRLFITNQIDILDHNGHIVPLFQELFALLETLDGFIISSNRALTDLETRIVEAEAAFGAALMVTDIEPLLDAANREVAQINHDLQRSSRFSLITVAVFLILAPALIFAAETIGLNRVIVRPLTRLMEAMQQVADGRFAAAAPIETPDEIGSLARAFNAMTAQLTASFARIERQNRELTRLDQLKDEFLANTSHELRTPLTGIAGLSEALLNGVDGALSAGQAQHVQMILQSSTRLTGLVNMLLDFSKVTSNTVQLHCKPFPLTEVIDIVAAFSQELLRAKPVTLVTDIPTDLPEIYGDIDRVEQIVTNVVGNALKFTQHGAVTISAWQDDEMVCIGVRDTGIGIPAEALERIFQPFEQVNGSTTREFGGTGLGLAITKELVELHGGHIRVESAVGVGSTFVISLPRADVAADAAPPMPAPQAGPRRASLSEQTSAPPSHGLLEYQPPADSAAFHDDGINFTGEKDAQFTGIPCGHGERILVVDDEPINIEVYKTHLTQYRYEVLAASDGLEALEVIDREQPDLVLLDLMMPKMSGFRVCQILRQEKGLYNLPIIMLTARSDIYDTVYGLNIGANDYVIKPFHQDELLTRIASLLKTMGLQHELLRNNERLHAEMRQREQAEAELAALNIELEHRVRQRTAQIEAVNAELRDFAYVVSHDLKAPLRGIMRLADWLRHDYAGTFDAHGQEMLDLLGARVARMDRLIDGVLQYSRAGRLTETREEVDLTAVVAEVLDSLAPPAHIRITIDPPLPRVMAEHTRMTQLFQNLVSNAIKFSDKPVGQIRIAARDDGAQWVFTVADNGPGIAPQHQTRIFQIFQTVASDDNRENTGVGLCIAKKIVEGYGGTIWVESEEGQGSTFFFTLPKSSHP